VKLIITEEGNERPAALIAGVGGKPYASSKRDGFQKCGKRSAAKKLSGTRKERGFSLRRLIIWRGRLLGIRLAKQQEEGR